MVQKYLGLQHQYGQCDCIQLIKFFFENELQLTFDLPYLITKWLKHFSTDNVDDWASKCAVKVKLTENSKLV